MSLPMNQESAIFLDGSSGTGVELVTLGEDNVYSPKEAARWVQRAIQEIGSGASGSSSAYIRRNGEEQHVEELLPNVFARLRTLAGVEELYLDDLCSGGLEDAPDWVGSRPAWRSASGKLYVQALDPFSATFLLHNAHRHLSHMESTPNSLLTRYVGLYDVGDCLPGGSSHVAVIKPPFPLRGRAMDYMYSLSGLDGPERFVQRTGVQQQLLLDANFVDEQQLIMVPSEKQNAILEALRDDSALLEATEAVGYTLLLGIRKVEEEDIRNNPLISVDAKSWRGSCRWGGSERGLSLDADTDLLPKDGIHGWRLNQEPVEYFMCFLGILSKFRPRKTLAEFIGKPAPIKPTAYRERFMDFLEARILPISDATALTWETSVHRSRFQTMGGPGRRRPEPGEGQPVNTLALLAAAEFEDVEGPTREDIARWRAVVDLLEAGVDARGLWRELGLAEVGLERLLPVFVADLMRRPLPPFTGTDDEVQKPKGVALSKIGKLLKSVDQVRALRTIGGVRVSACSKQYSLALAIAVGVEAATLCSARIARRSSRVFRHYPELRRRPAAVLARRSYFLPEEGSWLSPPHMLPDLHFVELAPEIFKEIRSSTGFDDRAYIRSVCPRDFSYIEFTTNSKSGSFFFFTHDARCMVKTITDAEADALLSLLKKGYLEHIDNPDGSLLARILGLYQVRLPWYNAGKPQHFIIQENLQHRCPDTPRRLFDLKGSRLGRTAKPGEHVLKDNDWIDRVKTFGFKMFIRDKLQRQHKRDCEFLAACGVIDYSVLVIRCLGLGRETSENGRQNQHRNSGVSMLIGGRSLPRRRGLELWDRVRRVVLDQEVVRTRDYAHGPHESTDGYIYHLGIIDFLIPWSLKKRAEYSFRIAQCQRRDASVNPPWRYARRQIAFMSDIW